MCGPSRVRCDFSNTVSVAIDEHIFTDDVAPWSFWRNAGFWEGACATVLGSSGLSVSHTCTYLNSLTRYRDAPSHSSRSTEHLCVPREASSLCEDGSESGGIRLSRVDTLHASFESDSPQALTGCVAAILSTNHVHLSCIRRTTRTPFKLSSSCRYSGRVLLAARDRGNVMVDISVSSKAGKAARDGASMYVGDAGKVVAKNLEDKQQ